MASSLILKLIVCKLDWLLSETESKFCIYMNRKQDSLIGNSEKKKLNFIWKKKEAVYLIGCFPELSNENPNVSTVGRSSSDYCV